ncbi:MAG: cation transporter [Bryobacterales bacterium]|nr:cation transporter [Bryobacterales bacterium]
MLSFTVKRRSLTALAAALFVAGCASLFPFLGAEFLPKLDEGAIAINVNRLASVLLPEAVKMTTTLEQVVKEFPEVTTVVTELGDRRLRPTPWGLTWETHTFS